MGGEGIEQALRQLTEAIRSGEDYAGFKALKNAVMADDGNRALLAEYQKAQTLLQGLAMAGREAEAEDVQRFSRLSGLLYMNDEVAGYLLAQLRLHKLVGDICQRVMEAAGLEMNLPGL